MKHLAIDSLLMRYIEGNVTEKESVAVWEAIQNDPETKRRFEALRRSYTITLWNVRPAKLFTRKEMKRRIVSWSVGVAASLTVAFVGISLYLNGGKQDRQLCVVEAPAGHISRVCLPDGTAVWLNAGSRISYNMDYNVENRRIDLQGEGYFEVAKDKKLPFVVNTPQQYEICVLGTTFNVNAYPSRQELEVVLLEGSLEVRSTTQHYRKRLSPGQSVVGTRHGLAFRQFSPLLTRWKDGFIVFENLKMSEVIERLELYYDVKVIVPADKKFEAVYNAKFRYQDGVEHILNALRLSSQDFQFVFNSQENTVVIK